MRKGPPLVRWALVSVSNLVLESYAPQGLERNITSLTTTRFGCGYCPHCCGGSEVHLLHG